MIRLAAPLPLKRCLTRANAASVPRIVAIRVASRAISMLRSTESNIWSGPNMFVQLSRVNSRNA
jgi:hypothetical protein